MLLNERQLIRRLISGDIIIQPIIEPVEQIGPSSVDLRLGSEFKVVKASRYTHLDPEKGPDQLRRDVAKYYETIRVAPMESFVLHPGDFALGSTLEYIRVPTDLVARLEGRSSWGRVGLLVHCMAGFVEPGFEGALTFELQNLGTVPIPLYPGIRVAQLCFYRIERSILPYVKKKTAKYAGRTGVIESLFFEDYEYHIIFKYLSERRASTAVLNLHDSVGER